MKKFRITKENAGERLDKYLSAVLDFSRSKIQRLISQGSITVNDDISKANYTLKEDDELELRSEKVKITSKRLIAKKEDLPKLEIVDETEEYLIIDKPAGLTVHGGKNIRGLTLVDALLERYPELAKIGEDPDRPAIVHRIDKDVSGLMVIPRTQDSFDSIKKQFQKRTVEKRYIGLVYGSISKDCDEINFPLETGREGNKMKALPETYKGEKIKYGKIASTYFEVLERFINYSLLKIKIKTGRKHQIRVHLSAYGNPLVGDILYNTKKTRELNAKLKPGRVMLAAAELSFLNLAGEKAAYKIDLPDDFKKFLKKVK